MPITEQDSILLTAIKKTAIILIVLYKAGRPLKGYEIVDILELNKDTVSKYLRALEKKGIVQNSGKQIGYTLTNKGIQLAFPNLEYPVLSDIIPTTSSLNINKTITITKDKELVVDECPKKSDFMKNKNLLASCGVGEPSLSKLADLDYVNPDFLMDHISKWRKENKQPGLLIFRIKSGEKAQRDPNRALSESERAKYTNW